MLADSDADWWRFMNVGGGGVNGCCWKLEEIDHCCVIDVNTFYVCVHVYVCV